jgi:hypothetical protein
MTPAARTVSASALESGVRLSSGRAHALTVVRTPTDIVFFVPGTQDPLNIEQVQHQANRAYWENTEGDYEPFLRGVRALKPQFLDLHVQHEYFSWTGDNNPQSRVEAAARMEDLLLRFYPEWTRRPVSLHLIGHSHGGNVINEFSKRIAAPNSTFPRSWRIKTIVYLSTPFFGRLHQLDASRLAPDCRVINVYNRYDLTQRVIADYNLRQMPFVMEEVIAANEDYVGGKGALAEVDTKAFEALRGLWLDDDEAARAWAAAIAAMAALQRLLLGLSAIVGDLRRDFPDFMPAAAAQTLGDALLDLYAWSTTARARLQRRTRGFTRANLLDDVGLMTAVGLLLPLLEYKPATFHSPLFDVLAEILFGRIEAFDDTTASPKDQLGGTAKLVSIPVTDRDPYSAHDRRAAFERFALRLEATQRQYAQTGSLEQMRETLVQLLAQLAPAQITEMMGTIIGVLNAALAFVTGDDDRRVRALRDSLVGYRQHIEHYRQDLAIPGHEDEPYPEQPGTLGYFAVSSHGVSMAALYDEVRAALTDSFSSGPNPGYVPGR